MKGSSPPGRYKVMVPKPCAAAPAAHSWLETHVVVVVGGGSTAEESLPSSRVTPSETRASSPDRHLPNLTRGSVWKIRGELSRQKNNSCKGQRQEGLACVGPAKSSA